MLNVGSVPPAVEAAALIGAVLTEASVLYLVYGTAERLLSGAVVDRIERL